MKRYAIVRTSDLAWVTRYRVDQPDSLAGYYFAFSGHGVDACRFPNREAAEQCVEWLTGFYDGSGWEYAIIEIGKI